MFDTTALKELAGALSAAMKVADAKARQHAQANETEPAGIQLARKERNRKWLASLTQAIATLDERAPQSRKRAGDTEPTEEFELFWAAYPRKVGKAEARRAWVQMKCEAKLQEILAAVGRCRQSFDWKKDGGQFIPHPSTWLRREGWSDQLDIAPTERPSDPRLNQKPAEDPPRWRQYLAGKSLDYKAFQYAPPHWKDAFRQDERESGF